ncbi:hypothetical protein GALMADRAFT_248499 [Galerina marginata CBS 339.88]|uniref:Uncharacterized protein n=1 Tax=Galerina marginata (strain CBS 339.88) TaxID=685588 RepID=A0A067T790_GALM3|nr:hypothetical protein GALMADRAFT_248499 [Galerina marginata CBS 339.88]
MNTYDDEIGRGRRGSGNDSSSSRESSPRRPAPKRAFSPPNSDDGGDVIRTTPNDETPPPQGQPLIRQPMAFSSMLVPSEGPTYEAAPPEPPAAGVFLPGQQVPIPPKPKAQKAKKTGTAAKRPRKGDAYPGQTTRFRITTYDPTPSAEPPINQGNGPYSSMYRGAIPPNPNISRQDSPAAVSSSSNGGYPSSSTASSNPAEASMRSVSVASRVSAQPISKPQQPPPPQRARLAAEKGRPPSSSYLEDPRPQQQPRDYYPQHAPPPSTASSSTCVPSSSSTVGPYYRRNYEAEVWEREPSRSPPPQRRSQNYSQAPGTSSRYQSRDSGPYSQNIQNTEITSPRRSKYPLRMVTLLIQDVRSGTTDHQLAEVKVPLRPGEHEEDGFWADAKDISEQLQMGPSRIDGPAKAYTLRGKYRQFILRVSSKNVDEFLSANVVIQPDRTLDLIVETLLPPGAPLPPPKIPTESSSSMYNDYDHDAISDRMDVDPRGDSRRPSAHETRDARKRVNSPSFDDYDGPDSAAPAHPVANKVARHDYAWGHSPRQSPRHTSPRSSNHSSLDNGPTRKRRSSARDSSTHHLSRTPEYTAPRRPPPSPPPQPDVMYATRSDHPEPTGSPPSADKFMTELRRFIDDEDASGFKDFFRAFAGFKNTDVLKQYTFIMKLIKNLCGKKIAGFEQAITEVHIIKAMSIDDESFLDNCKETMGLLELYGEKAGHYHDPRVTELIQDTKSLPNPNPRKRVLRFLRDIHDAWNNGRPEQPRPPSQDSRPPSEASDAPSRADASRHGPRGTKGLFV